jgi:hypothetical protein
MSDWFESASGSPVDVGALLDAGGVVDVFGRIVTAGALLSLGTTSDGGALALTVTVDGRWRREYFRESESMTSWLLEAAHAVEAATAAQPASPGPRRRQRRL